MNQNPKHPVQPLIMVDGVLRFKENKAISWVLDNGNLDLNRVHAQGFNQEDLEQVSMLVGYSLSGFGGLSHVSDETYERAEKQSSAAAPQVVADERAAQYVGVPYEFHDRYHVEKTEGGFWPYCVKCGDGTQSLYVGTLKQCELVASRLFGAFADGYFVAFAAAPVQAQEPVAYIWSVNGMVKTGGDPIFDDREKFYSHPAPVQPVDVPDGLYTFPIGEDGEYMILDKDGRQVGTVLYYRHAKAIAAALAAPAAQGDAKDAENAFVEFCEVNGYPSDSEMDGPFRKAFYAGIASKATLS